MEFLSVHRVVSSSNGQYICTEPVSEAPHDPGVQIRSNPSIRARREVLLCTCSSLVPWISDRATGADPTELGRPWSESAGELYRPSDRSLSVKLVSTFADRGCHVVSLTGPCGRNLVFLDRSRYFVFQVAPQLYSPG
jgi:hypothetical protein